MKGSQPVPELCHTCEKYKQRNKKLGGCMVYTDRLYAHQGTEDGQCLGYTTDFHWEEKVRAQVEAYSSRRAQSRDR